MEHNAHYVFHHVKNVVQVDQLVLHVSMDTTLVGQLVLHVILIHVIIV